MGGPIRCVVFAGLLAGCGDDSSLPGGDAAVGGGLVVVWSAEPATWPADLGDGLTIDRATFAIDSLRVVGDAAPGDPRTTASAFALSWDDAAQPLDLTFPAAPGGVYSQLSLLIDGHVAGPSIDIRGDVRVSGTDYSYRITDDSPFSVTLPIAETLQPPATSMLGLRIDFEHALESIDFAALDNNGGQLELDNVDPQIAAFRVKLRESIVIVD